MDWLTPSFLETHLPDLLGHVFYISILIGTILLTRKRKVGWLARCIGDIGWVTIGYMIGMYSIMIWSSVFFLNDFRGYLIWKWSEDENRKCQGKGAGTTKTRSPKNKRSLRPTRRRRGVEAHGKSGAGSHVEQLSKAVVAAQYRVQEHEDVPKPERPRASTGKRKARRNASSRLEAAEKRVRQLNRVHEIRSFSVASRDEGEE